MVVLSSPLGDFDRFHAEGKIPVSAGDVKQAMATVKKYSFELAGADGGPLRGDVRTAARGAGRPAVVICHGFKGFKDWGFFPHLAERIARAGMTTASFNFSGSGVGPDGESFSEPERFADNTYSRELRDVEIVVGAAAGGSLLDDLSVPTKFGLFGHSRGGAAALIHASENSAVNSLVTWSTFASVERWSADVIEQWRTEGKLDIVNARTGDVLPIGTGILEDMEQNSERLNLIAAAGKLRIPWLIVHGEEDVTVSVEDAESLHKAANNKMTELVILGGAGHTFGAQHPWVGMTPALSRAMDATVARFAKDLF